jgi:hypothetical protein
MTSNSIPAKRIARKFKRIYVRSILATLTGVIFCLQAQASETDEATRLQKLEQAVTELQQENKALRQQVGALQQHAPTAQSSTVGTAAPRPGPHQAATNTATSALAGSDFKSTPIDLTENGFVTSPPGKSPLAFQIGSVTFTPLGFLDFTSVTRGTLNGGDIGTSFASFPYSNTAAGQLSETRFSAKNSRLGLRMDTDLGDTKVLGYVETDFLGNAPANLNVVSNSDTLRMRVYFVDVQHGPWELLAGQDWSMLTPNRKGISPLPNDIFFTQNVDVNYQVGLVWERTPQLRLVYHASDQWTLGISAENPDQYVGPAVTLPANFTATQVDNGSNGTATPNFMPDLIAKVAYDTKIGGLPFHADLAGLYREFKINTFLPAKGTSSDAWASGYAGSFNLNIGVLPHLQLIENLYASNGAGREISTGVAPDFIVTGPDASGVDHIKTVNSYAGIAGFEWDVFSKTKLYGYYGQTYIDREYSQLANGSFVGYGFPGSSNSNNKRIDEYTVGLTQVLWKSERYGDLKLMLQYSYLDRDPWFVAPGAQSSAHMHMGYVDIRYDLP